MQALMPASVFVVGCGIGTESFNLSTAANMVRASAVASRAGRPMLHRFQMITTQ